MAVYSSMTREALFNEFVQAGAVLRDGHFRLSSGLHSDTYFDCRQITTRDEQFRDKVGRALIETIDRPVCIVGLKTLGNDLADWVADALKQRNQARFVPMIETKSPQKHCFAPCEVLDALSYIADRDVWLIDDVLTTGVNLRGAMRMVREYSGRVVGASVVCTHGNVTAEDLGLPQLDWLLELPMEKYDPRHGCPLCDKGVPLRDMKQLAVAS
jgi:orotate phosphoribosyltransferase